jgi:hypothetical protein
MKLSVDFQRPLEAVSLVYLAGLFFLHSRSLLMNEALYGYPAPTIGSVGIISSFEEEDTCMSYEEEDTCHLKRMHHLEVDWLHLLPPLREGAP